jgi:tRNA-splicing ligase RtcB
MDPARFTRIDPTAWRVEPSGAMRVPAIIYADENLIRDMDIGVTDSRSAAWRRSTRIAAV